MNRERRIVSLDGFNAGRCPECGTKMRWLKNTPAMECPKCSIVVKRKRSYGTYPSVKRDEHGVWIPAKYYRINPSLKYLRPTRRKTKVKGKEYVHYVISTTVPEEWKHGVKVTIEPVPSETSVEKLRQIERDKNEYGPDVRHFVEEHSRREEREADRDEAKHREWEKTT